MDVQILTKSFVSGVLILGLTAMAGCASGGKNWWGGAGDEGSFGVDLLVDGAALPVFELDGRSWVEGRPGERYVLRLHNRTARRIEVVVSVDGRDAVDGQPADDGKRGYVLAPWSVADVDGWRLSMAEVAAFRFTYPEDAYASRMGGDPAELGVVKVAVFEEERPPEEPRPPLVLPGQAPREERMLGPADRAAARGDARAAGEAEAGLGTGFGERRGSEAYATTFERASGRPAARLELRYDRADALCRKGLTHLCGPGPGPLVLPGDRPPPPPPPDDGYSQPPPGWDR